MSGTATEQARAEQARGTQRNPYKGPYSLTRDDRIYGRDLELAELESLLLSQRMLLLYSASGVGKTSLLQAGLRPRLARHGFDIVWVHGFRAAPEADASPWTNRYEAAVLARTSDGETIGRLSDVLDANPSPHLLLVIDQFEELFTLDRTDWPAKRAFLTELGRALEKPTRWAILALREEFLGELDPYSHLFPGDLQARMRLEPLSTAAAVDAIAKPAEEVGVHFDLHLAQQLARMLSRIPIGREDGVVTYRQGDAVEPMHLQLLCHELWTRWRAEHGNASRLTGSQVARLRVRYAVQDLDDVFAKYYDEAIAAASGQGTTERILRRWFERNLITVGGHRAPSQPPPDAPGSSDAVQVLEDRYIVRQTAGISQRRYELSHDRLIPAIRRANKERLLLLDPLYEMAKTWRENRHDDACLVTSGGALENIEAIESRHPGLVSEGEHDFIARSRKAQRSQRRRRAWILGAAAVAVVVLVALVAVWVRARVADLERTANGRAGAALLESERDPALGLRMAIDAGRVLHDRSRRLPEGLRSVLYRFAAALPTDRMLRLDGQPHLVVAIASTTDGSLLATGGLDGTVTMIDPNGEQPARLATFKDGDAPIVALTMADDGAVVSVDDDGRAVRWQRVAETTWERRGVETGVRAAGIRPDGEFLVLTGDGRSVRAVGTGDETGLPVAGDGLAVSQDAVATLIVAEDPAGPAAGAASGGFMVLGEGEVVRRDLAWTPTVARFSPDGGRLVIGGQDGSAAVVDGAEVTPFPETVLRSAVRSIVFTAPDRVVTATAEGAAVWELSPEPLLVRVVRHPSVAPLRLGAARSSEVVAVLTSAGTVEWWRTAAGHDGAIVSLVAAPRGVISGGEDGTLRQWDVDTLGSTVIAADEGSVSHVAAAGPYVVGAWTSGVVARFDDRNGIGAEPARFATSATPASALAVAETGAMAIATGAGELFIWTDGPSKAPLERTLEAPIADLAWSRDGAEVLVGLNDGRLVVFSGPNMTREAAKHPPIAQLTSVLWYPPRSERDAKFPFSHDDVWVTGDSDGALHVLARGVADSPLSDVTQAGAVTDLVTDASGEWVVSSSGLGHASLWSWDDRVDLEPRGTVGGPTAVSALAVDDGMLIVGGADGTVQRYALDDGDLLDLSDRASSWLPSANVCERLPWLHGCEDVTSPDVSSAVGQWLTAVDAGFQASSEGGVPEMGDVPLASRAQTAAAMAVAERYQSAIQDADWDLVREIGVRRARAPDETLQLAFGRIESSHLELVTGLDANDDDATRLHLVKVARTTSDGTTTLTGSCVVWDVHVHEVGSGQVEEVPEFTRVVDRHVGEDLAVDEFAGGLVDECSR